MKLIIITSPAPVAGEISILSKLFSLGVHRIHLRRPTWSKKQTREFLSQLPKECLPNIVLHDHHELVHEFNLGGIHLNSRNPLVLNGYTGAISRSCHTFQEVIQYKEQVDYLFLSPIFDSISKVGVQSAFTDSELSTASNQGILDEKVFALGGVTPSRAHQLNEWSFGGAVVLGDFWSKVLSNSWREYLQHWQEILTTLT